MMSHINSTAREVLNFAIPYDMATIYIGMDKMKKLNIYKIQPDDIILKPYLINNKKQKNMLDKVTKKVEFSLGQSKNSTLNFKFRCFLIFT